ncbi:MAG: hypothetical protein ACRERE_08250, partial [Candidatus Entotheonellia bacterium]
MPHAGGNRTSAAGRRAGVRETQSPVASDEDAYKADERLRRLLLSADALGGSGVERGKLMMPRQGTSGIGADCALCHLSENPDQTCIFGNDSVLFLQNAQEQGALLGSGVIIPVRHAETVFDLTPEEL